VVQAQAGKARGILNESRLNMFALGSRRVNGLPPRCLARTPNLSIRYSGLQARWLAKELPMSLGLIFLVLDRLWGLFLGQHFLSSAGGSFSRREHAMRRASGL
jgi:hypothetical protein